KRVPGREPEYSSKEGLVGVVEPGVLQICPYRLQVGTKLGLGIGPERFQLAREDEAAAGEAVVEGLDPEAVARAEQALALGIPECERPHAVEALDAALAPLAVGGEHDLGVGCAAEAVALRLQL